MESNFPYELFDHEIYRYLGYRGQTPDAAVLEKIARCKEHLLSDVTPKAIWKYYDITWVDEETFTLEGQQVHSVNLSRNLRGCNQVILMAATLGPAPDRYIQKAQITAMSDAVIYQAGSAAMIESYCNHINDEMKREAATLHLFLRPRFSPGYGDFPLEFQKSMGQMLRMSKEIGVTLTDSLLMMPSKSVTAIIGVSTEDNHCHMGGCEICNKSATCSYRRDTIEE